jgi:hemerythrin superfamily protein
MPNPIQIIKEDHTRVEALFNAYSEIDAELEDKREETANELLKELTIHAKMEEELFYPKVKELLGEEHPDMVEEAIAEHHAAKLLIAELKIMTPKNPQFDAKMKVLEEQVMHHVDEEESDMLEEAENLMSQEDKEALGQEMEEFKADKQKSLLEKLLGE